MTKIKIKRAIVSVYDKSYLNILADYFVENNIEVLSTGGTSKFLKSLNNQIKIVDISEFTKSDEILDGRVKTLHPMIHSGILAQKNNPSHLTQIKKIKVPPIDLVVVNLYPFESVFQKKGVSEEECIENIDIGGPTMIRAAAKNFQNVTVLTDPKNYLEFVSEVMINNNAISSESRKKFAKLAFENTSYYEGLISNWFNKNNGEVCENKTSLPIEKISKLRYGENPHQKGTLFKFGKNKFTKLSGKDLSFNNIFDLEIAMELAEQFSKPSCVILKHGNPCGVALDKNQDKAYLKAYKCDKVSAFGGVVAFNKGVTAKTAKEINKIFTEIVIAPEFSSESIKYLSLKKNLILIRYRAARKPTKLQIKSTRNFLLVQSKDNKIVQKKDLVIKTKKKPKYKMVDDLIFAFIVSKYVNSNAIVLANDLSTVGIGVGQTNRLDSAIHAISRMKKNFKKIKPVMASDGFFPFADIVVLCSKNNVSAIIQPGGSKNDGDVIDAADKNEIPLVFTSVRHFKH